MHGGKLLSGRSMNWSGTIDENGKLTLESSAVGQAGTVSAKIGDLQNLCASPYRPTAAVGRKILSR